MRCRTFRCKQPSETRQTNKRTNQQSSRGRPPAEIKTVPKRAGATTQTNKQTIKQSTSHSRIATRGPVPSGARHVTWHRAAPLRGRRCRQARPTARSAPTCCADQTEIGRRGVSPRYYSRPICRPFLQWCAARRGGDAASVRSRSCSRRRSVVDVPMERPYADGAATRPTGADPT